MTKTFCFEDLLDHYMDAKIPKTDHISRIPQQEDYKPTPSYGYHIPDTRKILNRFRSFTIEELRSEWDLLGFIDEHSKNSAYGKLIPTIEWLESTGYISYLPDTDGQLTFCKTEYLYQLLEESNLPF